MIGLLTAFFFVHADVEWYWWAVWGVIQLIEISKETKKRI